jgi:hypothetical protein
MLPLTTLRLNNGKRCSWQSLKKTRQEKDRVDHLVRLKQNNDESNNGADY